MKLPTCSLFLLVALWQTTVAVQYYYMDNHCGDTTYIGDQARLQTTSSGYYSKNMDCTWTVKADYGYRLMVYINSYDIYSSSGCTDDYLELDDGSSTLSPYLTSTSRYCGVNYVTSSVYRTTGRALTLRFKSGSSSFADSGFDVIVTQYRTGSCYSYEHRCNNGRCIDRSLECTLYNPCGDNSDCTGDFVVSTGTITGAVVGGTFFVVFVVVVAAVICRRRRMYYSGGIVGAPAAATTTTTTTTAVAAGPYNSGYNQSYPQPPQPPQYGGPQQQAQYPRY